MLSCKEIVGLVTDYAEGRMGLWDRLRFRLHLRMCPVCREYVRQMQATIKTLGRLPAEPPPPEVMDALREAFRDWKKKS